MSRIFLNVWEQFTHNSFCSFSLYAYMCKSVDSGTISYTSTPPDKHFTPDVLTVERLGSHPSYTFIFANNSLISGRRILHCT